MNVMKVGNSLAAGQTAAGLNKADPAGFGKAMKAAVENAENLEKEADASVLRLLEGNEDVHKTMLALQKADISMRMLLSVRNKALEAYRDIMHMQF
jgi:flagellar hook-basal body complex protein FliE